MDPVNPPWYDANGIKLVEVQEAFVPDKPYRWPAFKYLARAGKKPGQDEVQDLRKAIWWIEREIQQIEGRKVDTFDEMRTVTTAAEWQRELQNFADCQDEIPEWRRGGIRLSGGNGDGI